MPWIVKGCDGIETVLRHGYGWPHRYKLVSEKWAPVASNSFHCHLQPQESERSHRWFRDGGKNIDRMYVGVSENGGSLRLQDM